jgi:hypothetical protein
LLAELSCLTKLQSPTAQERETLVGDGYGIDVASGWNSPSTIQCQHAYQLRSFYESFVKDGVVKVDGLTTLKPFEASIKRLVEDTVRSKHPETVGDLSRIIVARGTVGEDDLVPILKDMAREGSLVLREPRYRIETSLDYLFTLTLSAWLWATLGGTSLAVLAVLYTPDHFPVVIVRWLLGSMLVLFLPGYAFIQFLFPKGSEIDSLERLALNIGLSLALVPLIGLVLNYTPWGIRFAPITASLASFTFIFTIAAAMRKYFALREESLKL